MFTILSYMFNIINMLQSFVVTLLLTNLSIRPELLLLFRIDNFNICLFDLLQDK